MTRTMYALVLRFYPRDFRRQWEHELRGVADEALRAARASARLPARLRVALWLLLDAFAALPGAWRDAHVVARSNADGAGDDGSRPAHTPAGQSLPPTASIPGGPAPSGRPRQRGGAALAAILRQDIRHSLRLWRRAPGFTAFAIGTLALGMGAVIAIFSVINGVLLRPMPYTAADRVMISPGYSWADLDDLRQASSIEGVAFWQGWRAAFRENDGSVGVRLSAAVTPDFFELLGVRPALGRLFRGQDDPQGDDVVLSWGTWQADFGGRTDIVGQAMVMDGRSYTIIGVAASHFADPLAFPVQDIETAMYRLLPPPPPALRTQRNFRAYMATLRLRPGFTPNAAKKEIEGRIGPYYAQLNIPANVQVTPAQEARTGNVKPTLYLLSGAVALLLLIGCANAANLLLSRATVRRRELTVRGALGAARPRLIAQLLTESLLLALAAGAVGVWLGYLGSRGIIALGGTAIPRGEEVNLDPRVIAFAFGMALLTAVLFGLAPAVQWSRLSFSATLRENARGSTGSRTGSRLRHTLVVLETALAVMLSFGAGLLGRSLWKLQHVRPGYDAENVLTLRVTMNPARYPAPRRVELHEQITDALARLPGVTAAAAVNLHPLSGGAQPLPVGHPGDPVSARSPTALFHPITPDYFRTMGIHLSAGRELQRTDGVGGEPVVVINEALAKKLFEGANPLGQSLAVLGQPYRVVGVAPNVNEFSLSTGGEQVVYITYAQSPAQAIPATSTFLVRGNGDARAFNAQVRAAIRDIDANLPIAFLRTMREMMDIDLLAPRLRTLLIVCFGVLAALLAAIGLTGVMAYTVSQSIPEIGVRMALGARERDVAAQVLKQSLRLTLTGLVIGLAGSLAAGHTVANMLFGIPPTDSTVLAGVAVSSTLLALLATWYPAHRAARVSPAAVLRSL